MNETEKQMESNTNWAVVDDIITQITSKLHDKCLSFLGEDEEGNCVIIDPIDDKVIGAHYAMTHIAAALIISGRKTNRLNDIEKGIKLIKGVLKRWEMDTKASDFHYDFNNFALCLIYDELEKDEQYIDLCQEIRETIMSTGDSRHFTVNWLPMRMFVNYHRYLWANDKQYEKTICDLYTIIKKATNQDGFVEDLLPKGKSFNLQYNVATVAVLQFLNDKGAEYSINDNIIALVNACDPAGDINYLGRGCNQIFAWGLWIYLLKSQGIKEQCLLSVNYLAEWIDDAIANNNLLLNQYPGEQKMLWWDYHYSSVYLGHLYLWLVLAENLKDRNSKIMPCEGSYGTDSGVRIIRKKEYFVCLFEGRKQYLAEYGPIVANLWLKEPGYLMKGTFGPWMGQFGKKYSNFLSFFNYFGPIQIGGYGEIKFHRFGFQLKSYESGAFKIPKVQVSVNESDNKLIICFVMRKSQKTMFNIPLCNQDLEKNLIIKADDNMVHFRQVGDVLNQYGRVAIYQTGIVCAKAWSVEIAL